MHGITDADRAAAQELRVVLADICGFWHRSGDDSPLCAALARHRIEAEQRLMQKLSPVIAMPSKVLVTKTHSPRASRGKATGSRPEALDLAARR